MNKYVKKEISFAGKNLVLETGEIALRATMAVKATYGETVVLVTAVSGNANPDKDFFPLTVNYEEKLYASGSIKSSRFVKRDGRGTDDAIIAQRAIDHAIRPLFPKDYMDDVQVIATVLSVDEEADAEFTSMIAVSAALHASNIPWYGPMATARVGLVDGKLVLCPSREVLHDKSDLEMIVSFVGKEKRFLAVEAGANVLPETKILEAINFGRGSVDPLLALIEDFANELNPGIKKYTYVSRALGETLLKDVSEAAKDKVDALTKQALSKHDLDAQKILLRDEVVAKFDGVYTKVDIVRAIEDLEKESIRHVVLDENKRLDGRGLTEVRPISGKVNLLPRTHGSALFTRGTTQALTVATLGSPSMELLVQDMYGERSKRFMHYYNFPPYSTGEVGKMGSPRGREIGHGMIAEKGLKPVMPIQKEFPYTIILVSETVSSNGSSSMASTCGATLALMDAGVPLKDMVGGVAMGLIVSDDEFTNYKVLTDLSGEEDGGGFLDFKMTGTKTGVTAIQCDMKVKGMPMHVLEEVINQSRDGRLFILDEMQKVISTSRETVSKYAPKVVTTKIDPDKIGMVIGSGGKTIKEIQERTGAEISIEEDGTVVISCADIEKAQEALKIVEGITHEVKPGEIYEGTVIDLLDFGAIVEILPGKTGLLHISEVADRYVENINEWFKMGDVVKVKVLRVEREGKIALSKKALEAPQSDQ